jgi:para-nitrobenzyl esterase
MVWIYGGSNKGGWSFEPNYDGENLAARGRVVVVTIAYRVGVFGFFGHPELRGTPAPANFGLLDQVAALRWVQQNIRAFGGDPRNVTLFGQSAGATDIAYLVTSPLGSGLFQRAIAESGGSQMIAQGDLAESEQVGLDLTNALPGHPDLAAMRARSSAEIFAAADTALRTHNWRPVIDGRAVLMAPAVFYRRHRVPFDLLTGSTDNESYMYVDGDPASLAADLQQYSPAPRAILAALAAQHADVHRGHDRAMTLVHFGCPPYLMAAGAARNGRRSWVYRFTRVRPGPGGEQMLAYHGAEIPYVFDTHDSWLSGDEADTALTTAMVAYWSNFARNGDPNGPGLAPWPAYDGDRARVLELGTRIGAAVAHDSALCDRLAGDVYPGWAN